MKRDRGFTLIELLVVIAIIGLLSSIIFSAITRAKLNAQQSARVQNKNSIVTALNLYYNDNGHYPNTGPDTWYCFGPSSYTCANGTHTGSDALVAQMSPYISSFPHTDAVPGTYLYNAFKYEGDNAPGGQGSWLLWGGTDEITDAECPPPGHIDTFDIYYYCWQYLGE